MNTSVFLTVRGITVPKTQEAARKLHNETAGSEQGKAAARSLGDLSHKVYVPLTGDANELLFHDVWESPVGLQEFFGNKNVQEQGGKLFSQRDPAVWMPAQGALSFHLPAPSGRNDRYVGMVRAKITSPEQAIAAFRAGVQKGMRDARKRGQLSHEIFFRLGDGPAELLGVDLWFDADGMREHYGSMHMEALAPAFAGAPDASMWQAAPGGWSEW